MKKSVSLFVFVFVIMLASNNTDIAAAAVAGEQCNVNVGNAGIGSQTRTGVCRPNPGTGSICQTNEDNLGFGNCVVSGGVASQCCSTKIPAATCAGAGGMCWPAGTCATPVPGNPSCYPSSTEVCCQRGAIGVTPGANNSFTVAGSNQVNYPLLEQIPGSSETVGRLDTYLRDIYIFAFWAVGIAVVFMLTIGGFMYLTSAGNTSRMGSAKTIIFDAILGLILALVAWLFLYVVNPDLVNLNLRAISITPISTTAAPAATTPGAGTPAPGPGTGGPTSTGLYTHAEAMAALAAGISVSSTGNCSNPNNSSCTSLEGIPVSVINRVNTLRTASGCSLVITGGTETGHKTHGAGRGSVDFREDSCLGNFLRNNVTNLMSYGIAKICAPPAWVSALRAQCTENGTPHFHLQFSI